MQRIGMVLLLALAVAGEPEILGVYPADTLTGVQQGEHVHVEVDESTATEGKGSIEVTYNGTDAAEAMLFSQELADIDNAILWYEADMRCDAPGGMAYAALWVIFPDGSRYFSRGLDQRCGPDWRRSRIPFRLEKGQRPDRVVMGVRFEGPGTVWVDNARLVRSELAAAGGGQAQFFARAICLAAGLWGALAGIMVSRGKGKRLVLGLGASLLFLELLMLGAGIGLLASGYAPGVWGPLVAVGAVGTLLLSLLLPLLMKRYRDYEVRRLAAQDASDSL